MKIYQYKDYDHYVKSQIAGNLRKIDGVVKTNSSYASKTTIKKITSHFNQHRDKNADSVLCHGTRNAREQLMFQDYWPKAYIIGSEISTNATDFPMTVEHDFNVQRYEWVNKFDVVYSNSFDHTITPRKTLTVWRDQLNENGLLYLEHTTNAKNHVSDATDPLMIETQELKDLIADCDMKIIQELKSNSSKGYVLICEKK